MAPMACENGPGMASAISSTLEGVGSPLQYSGNTMRSSPGWRSTAWSIRAEGFPQILRFASIRPHLNDRDLDSTHDETTSVRWKRVNPSLRNLVGFGPESNMGRNALSNKELQ